MYHKFFLEKIHYQKNTRQFLKYSSSIYHTQLSLIMCTKIQKDTLILQSWMKLCPHDHLQSTKFNTLPSIWAHSSFNLTLLLFPLVCIWEINLCTFIKTVRSSDAKTESLISYNKLLRLRKRYLQTCLSLCYKFHPCIYIRFFKRLEQIWNMSTTLKTNVQKWMICKM